MVETTDPTPDPIEQLRAENRRLHAALNARLDRFTSLFFEAIRDLKGAAGSVPVPAVAEAVTDETPPAAPGELTEDQLRFFLTSWAEMFTTDKPVSARDAIACAQGSDEPEGKSLLAALAMLQAVTTGRAPTGPLDLDARAIGRGLKLDAHHREVSGLKLSLWDPKRGGNRWRVVNVARARDEQARLIRAVHAQPLPRPETDVVELLRNRMRGRPPERTDSHGGTH